MTNERTGSTLDALLFFRISCWSLDEALVSLNVRDIICDNCIKDFDACYSFEFCKCYFGLPVHAIVNAYYHCGISYPSGLPCACFVKTFN